MKKINIGSILGDCIVDIRLKNDSQIHTGYLIKSKQKKGMIFSLCKCELVYYQLAKVI